jgi:hypothetical protein
MLKGICTITAGTLIVAAFAVAVPSVTAAAPKASSGRITGIAVDPADPARGSRLKAKSQSRAKHFHGVVNRFSQGRKY